MDQRGGQCPPPGARPQPGSVRHRVPSPDPAELEVLGRGIPVRAVHDDAGLRNPAAIARRRAEIAAGQQARITSSLPVHLLLADSDLALLPLTHGPAAPAGGLLVVHPCALLDALSALFEMTWAGALPLSLDATTDTDGQPPVLRNPTTRTILGLLAAGLCDRAIARRLGCSERTIQRHILRISEAAGAKTRFQAGLHIGRRNWTQCAPHTETPAGMTRPSGRPPA